MENIVVFFASLMATILGFISVCIRHISALLMGLVLALGSFITVYLFSAFPIAMLFSFLITEEDFITAKGTLLAMGIIIGAVALCIVGAVLIWMAMAACVTFIGAFLGVPGLLILSLINAVADYFENKSMKCINLVLKKRGIKGEL